LARLPMTKAISASKSTLLLAAGSATVSPSARSALRNLAKKVGLEGGSCRPSLACSA